VGQGVSRTYRRFGFSGVMSRIGFALASLLFAVGLANVACSSADEKVTDADFIIQVQPDYPDAAREHNIQGDVLVSVVIGPQGQLVESSIRSSSGSKLLDDAALKAATSSTFRPPLHNGVPTQRAYLIRYTFRLGE